MILLMYGNLFKINSYKLIIFKIKINLLKYYKIIFYNYYNNKIKVKY